MKSKKGALSLSIEAIVIIVIAFVVLGLALTLTRYVFKAGMSKAGEAIDVVDLDIQPTAENTITIPDKIIIKRSDTREIKMGFYNRRNEPDISTAFRINSCKDSKGVDVDGKLLPTIISPSQDVEPSTAKGYKAIFTENGLVSGTYICIIEAYNTQNPETAAYDSKQFFLTVTA